MIKPEEKSLIEMMENIKKLLDISTNEDAKVLYATGAALKIPYTTISDYIKEGKIDVKGLNNYLNEKYDAVTLMDVRNKLLSMKKEELFQLAVLGATGKTLEELIKD